MLIVNRYGIYHEIPDHLLGVVTRQGGREATAYEASLYAAGKERVGQAFDPAPAIAPTAALPLVDGSSPRRGSGRRKGTTEAPGE